MPLISVIVPVYKVERYLRRCVDSILAQTFTGFELILVDDGSPDNCGMICDEYAAQDSRIHVIHQKNGGLSAARNAGIDWAVANSDSRWLSFVDSDDWVHPSFLDFLYRAVKETGTQVSACGIRKVEGEEKLQDVEYYVESMPWDKFYLSDYLRGVVAWNKLYDKNLFEGLRYPVGKIHEDQFLTYRLLDRAGIVCSIRAELYYYFQNSAGIMSSQFSMARLDDITALDQQCLFAKQNGYDELYLKRKESQIRNLSALIVQCQGSTNLSANDKKKALHGMRIRLRKLLLTGNRSILQSKEKKWYYECAYPRLMWCYWAIVGIISKIRRKVKRNA